MLSISNRWFFLTALLISGVLWVVVGSVFANAVHILAKSNYSWPGFGSMSIWLIAIGLAWLLVVSYMLVVVKAGLTVKSLATSFCMVSIWVALLGALTALGDEMLGKLGAAAIIVWVVEFAVALFLVNQFSHLSLPFPVMQKGLGLTTVTLTWLMTAKILLLWLSSVG